MFIMSAMENVENEGTAKGPAVVLTKDPYVRRHSHCYRW
jgi:hypothetical protein